ncbi:hypothetical protein GCM10022232_63740 [Streptomyces plumbiresistens]|uniref:Uncharacterized protein n=1 Tax=Streptomyces plumbiresistens TaxID=511811 RepID=A0ABP7SKR5_9ACTN
MAVHSSQWATAGAVINVPAAVDPPAVVADPGARTAPVEAPFLARAAQYGRAAERRRPLRESSRTQQLKLPYRGARAARLRRHPLSKLQQAAQSWCEVQLSGGQALARLTATGPLEFMKR